MKSLARILIICIFLFDLIAVFSSDLPIKVFSNSCADILARIVIILLLCIIIKK